MGSAVIFMQWESYESEMGHPVFFRHNPLTFNSRQERLHKLCEGDRLWLVSRCPADQQYYFVAMLAIAATKRNDPGSPEVGFGEFGVIVEALSRRGTSSRTGIRIWQSDQVWREHRARSANSADSRCR